jgi:hypothetical protein
MPIEAGPANFAIEQTLFVDAVSQRWIHSFHDRQVLTVPRLLTLGDHHIPRIVNQFH